MSAYSEHSVPVAAAGGNPSGLVEDSPAANYSDSLDAVVSFAKNVQASLNAVNSAAMSSALKSASSLVNGTVANNIARETSSGGSENTPLDGPIHVRDQFTIDLLHASLSQQSKLLRASEASVIMERAQVERSIAEETTKLVVAAAASIAERCAHDFDQGNVVEAALMAKSSTLESTTKQLVEFVGRSVLMTSNDAIASAKERANLERTVVEKEVLLSKAVAAKGVLEELVKRNDVQVNQLMETIKILSDERDELSELPRMLDEERAINRQLEGQLNLQGIATAVVKEREAAILAEQEARKKDTEAANAPSLSQDTKSLRPLLDTFPTYPSPIHLPSNLSLVKLMSDSPQFAADNALKRFAPDLMALKIVQRQKFTISELVRDWELKYHEVESLRNVVQESERARLDVCVQMSSCLAALTEERQLRKLEEQHNQKLSLERAGGVTGRLGMGHQFASSGGGAAPNSGTKPLFYRSSVTQQEAPTGGAAVVLTGEMGSVPSHVSPSFYRSVPFDAEESAHTITCLHERLNACHDEIVAFQARVAELYEEKKILTGRCDSAEKKTHRLEQEHRCSKLVANVESVISEYTKERHRFQQLLTQANERVLHANAVNESLGARLDETSARIQASEGLVHELTSTLQSVNGNSAQLQQSIAELEAENSRLWGELTEARTSALTSSSPNAKEMPNDGLSCVGEHITKVEAILNNVKQLSLEALQEAFSQRRKVDSSDFERQTDSQSSETALVLRGVLDVAFRQIRITDKIQSDINETLGDDLAVQRELLSELDSLRAERDAGHTLVKNLVGLISKYNLNISELVLSDDDGTATSSSAAQRMLHEAISSQTNPDDAVLTLKRSDPAFTDAVKTLATPVADAHSKEGVEPHQYRMVLRAEQFATLQREVDELKATECEHQRERHELQKRLEVSNQELSMKEFWIAQLQAEMKKLEEGSLSLRKENSKLLQDLQDHEQFSQDHGRVMANLLLQQEECPEVDGDESVDDESTVNEEDVSLVSPLVATEDEEKGYFFQDEPRDDEVENVAENFGGRADSDEAKGALSIAAVSRKRRSPATKLRRRLQKSLTSVKDLLQQTIALNILSNISSNSNGGAEDGDAEVADEEPFDSAPNPPSTTSVLESFQRSTAAALTDLTAQLRQCVNAATAVGFSGTSDEGTAIPTNPSHDAEEALSRHERRERDRILKDALKDLRESDAFKEAVAEETKALREREAALLIEGSKRKEAIERMLTMNKELLAHRKALQAEVDSLKSESESASSKVEALEAAISRMKSESMAGQVGATKTTLKPTQLAETAASPSTQPAAAANFAAEPAPDPITHAILPSESTKVAEAVEDTNQDAEEDIIDDEDDSVNNNPFAFGGSPFENIVGAGASAFEKRNEISNKATSTTAASGEASTLNTPTPPTSSVTSKAVPPKKSQVSAAKATLPAPAVAVAKAAPKAVFGAPLGKTAVAPAFSTSAAPPVSPFAALGGKTPVSDGKGPVFPVVARPGGAASFVVAGTPNTTFGVPPAAAARESVPLVVSTPSQPVPPLATASPSTQPTAPSGFAAKTRRFNAAAAAAAAAPTAKMPAKAPFGGGFGGGQPSPFGPGTGFGGQQQK